jgi:very-short-patch-repair endonuclease
MGAPARPTLTSQSPARGVTRGAAGPESDPDAPRTVILVGGWRVRVAPDRSTDERIDAIATRQRARASWDQLLLAGVHPGAIKRRAANGRLVRVHPRVYALPNTLELPLAAETAALLAGGSDAVLSHHSAATLMAIRPGIARPVHITVPMSRRGPALDGVVVHRSRILTPADIGRHDGLPVTSPARMLLDVAATLPDGDMERLLDDALFGQRLVTIARVDELLARCGGHPGRARLARVVGRYSESLLTESPPEEQLRRLIAAADLPAPRAQVTILGYRLDFYWPALRLAAEVDTYGTHGSRTRFEADRRRDARLLTEKGIVVLRFTRAAILERPYEVVALLAGAIARREHDRTDRA